MMRHHLSLAISILFAVAPLTAFADVNPCSLLTTAQVTAAMGTPMQAGTPGPTNCTWLAQNGSSNVSLAVRSADVYAPMRSEAQFHSCMTPVAGVGDDAFFFADSKASSLYVLKGSVTLKDSQTMLIAIQASGFTTDQTQVAEKALAAQALTKLAAKPPR